MSQDRTDFGPSWFRVHPAVLPLARGRHAPRHRHLRRDRHGLQERHRPILHDDRNLRTRDVICAGMYRACSTWQYEVVGHLVELHRQGQRMGYVTGDDYQLTGSPLPRRWGSDQPGAWRVLKSHEGHRSFSRALGSGGAIAVYAFRDIRDVVCSLMHKRGENFQQLLRQGMIHQVLANDRFWRAQPRVLVQRFEEMVRDPVTAVVQLARHLGLGVTRRQAIAIADEYSLESNLTRIEALRQQLVEAGIDLTAAGNLQIYDSVTLLHWNHVRPGGSGSWPIRLSSREIAVLSRMCVPWLEANGYQLQASSGSEGELLPLDRMSAARERLDLAMGWAASVLRCAAGSCPLAARMIKQLLRIAPPALASDLAWPLIDASKALRHTLPHPVSGPGKASRSKTASPCRCRPVRPDDSVVKELLTLRRATGSGDTPGGVSGRIRRPDRLA